MVQQQLSIREQNAVVQYFTSQLISKQQYSDLTRVVGLDEKNLSNVLRHRLSPGNQQLIRDI